PEQPVVGSRRARGHAHLDLEAAALGEAEGVEPHVGGKEVADLGHHARRGRFRGEPDLARHAVARPPLQVGDAAPRALDLAPDLGQAGPGGRAFGARPHDGPGAQRGGEEPPRDQRELPGGRSSGPRPGREVGRAHESTPASQAASAPSGTLSPPGPRLTGLPEATSSCTRSRAPAPTKVTAPSPPPRRAVRSASSSRRRASPGPGSRRRVLNAVRRASWNAATESAASPRITCTPAPRRRRPATAIRGARSTRSCVKPAPTAACSYSSTTLRRTAATRARPRPRLSTSKVASSAG